MYHVVCYFEYYLCWIILEYVVICYPHLNITKIFVTFLLSSRDIN
jgi:hypothetical protein